MTELKATPESTEKVRLHLEDNRMRIESHGELVSALILARGVCYQCKPKPQGVIDKINAVLDKVGARP
jgi:hypothetical protein